MARPWAPIASTIAWSWSKRPRRVISRALVIVLAFGAAVYRATQAAWIEAAGLASLGCGLVILGLAARRPALRPLAWLAFLLTAGVVVIVLLRGRPA